MNNPLPPAPPQRSILIPDPRLQMELDQAEQLLSEKRAQRAAPLFVQVARAAQQAGYPRQAANVYTRAAHAYANADDEENALANARLALDAFIQLKMPRRFTQFYTNITLKMEKRGMQAAVQVLQESFSESFQKAQTEMSRNPEVSGRLPAECSHCGAPLFSEDVTWRDNYSFACSYCGQITLLEDR